MDVTRETLLKETREHLQEHRGIDPARVEESTNLRDDLGLDSLDVAELGMRWARDYGVLLEEEQMLNIETLGEALDHVMASVRAGAGG